MGRKFGLLQTRASDLVTIRPHLVLPDGRKSDFSTGGHDFLQCPRGMTLCKTTPDGLTSIRPYYVYEPLLRMEIGPPITSTANTNVINVYTPYLFPTRMALSSKHSNWKCLPVLLRPGSIFLPQQQLMTLPFLPLPQQPPIVHQTILLYPWLSNVTSKSNETHPYDFLLLFGCQRSLSLPSPAR